MPVPIISASGTQYGLIVNADGSINTAEGDTTPTVGYNPAWTFVYGASGLSTGMIGSSIGSIIQFIGAGSYIQTLSWKSGLVVGVGSWS